MHTIKAKIFSSTKVHKKLYKKLQNMCEHFSQI